MKRPLRQEVLSELTQISFDQLIRLSDGLQNQFRKFAATFAGPQFFQKALISYFPLEHEPQIQVEPGDPDQLAPMPFELGYLRIEDWTQRKMKPFRARRDLPECWEEFQVPGGHTLFQPKASNPEIALGQIGAILVPGLAFTESGHRLGRGAGFYDRFLDSVPAALRVGIAFELQIKSQIPTEPHDATVDIILTESRCIETKIYSQWLKHGMIKSRSDL